MELNTMIKRIKSFWHTGQTIAHRYAANTPVIVMSLAIVFNDWLPIGNIFDFTKPMDKAVYSAYVFIGELLWTLIAPQLAMALIFNALNNWVIGVSPQLLEFLGGPLSTLLGLTLTIATSLYGLSKVFSVFIPSWKPVDIGQAFLYGVLGFAYLSSGAFLVEAIETARQTFGTQITNMVSGESFSLVLGDVSGGLSEGSFAMGAPYSIDNNPDNYSGIDIAATYAGVTHANQVFSTQLPPSLRTNYRYADPDIQADCCFKYAYDANGFDLLTDAQRSEQLAYAQYGLIVLFQAGAMVPYALAESAVWLILTLIALIIFISLPIGFIFSVFQATSGLLSRYMNQYIELFKETIVTAIFLGIVQAMLIQALVLPVVLLYAVLIIGLLVVVWRIFSALKLLTSAAEGMMSGVATGVNTGSAVSIQNAARATVGAGAGGAVAAAGVLSGNVAMVSSGLTTIGKSVQAGIGGGNAPSISGALNASRAAQGKGNRGASTNGRQRNNGKPLTVDESSTTESEKVQSSRMRPASPPPVQRRPSASQTGERKAQTTRPATSLLNRIDRASYEDDSQAATMTQADDASIDAELVEDAVTQPGEVTTTQADNAPIDSELVEGSVKRLRGFVSYASRAQTETEQVGKRYGPSGRKLADIIAEPGGKKAINIGAKGVAGKIDELTQQGLSQDEIVDEFRKGRPLDELKEWLPKDSPFQERDNFNNLADVMLQPDQPVSYDDVVTSIAQGTRDNTSILDGTAAALGMPSPEAFGGYTGLISSIGTLSRNVGAEEIADSETGESYLEQASRHVSYGDLDEARQTLTHAAANPETVDSLVDSLAVAHDVLGGDRSWTVPQTVAFEPGDQNGYQEYQAAQQRPQKSNMAQVRSRLRTDDPNSIRQVDPPVGRMFDAMAKNQPSSGLTR